LLRERVEVEDQVPGGLGFAIFGERRASPQALRMGGVLPEIIDVVPAPADLRNAVVGVEQRERSLAVRLEARVAERLDGLLVACRDPVAHLRARDFLEPEIGVVGVCGGHSRLDLSLRAVKTPRDGGHASLCPPYENAYENYARRTRGHNVSNDG